jgi:hypothetical protein
MGLIKTPAFVSTEPICHWSHKKLISSQVHYSVSANFFVPVYGEKGCLEKWQTTIFTVVRAVDLGTDPSVGIFKEFGLAVDCVRKL